MSISGISSDSFGEYSIKEDEKPNYGKAALYIAIATVAAIAFTALLVGSGGGIVVAGFMISIGLEPDAIAIVAGVIFLAIFAAFMLYETIRLSIKADKILHPAAARGSFDGSFSL